MDFRDDILFLGTRYFSVVRTATRRDMAEAEDFFGVPSGQAGYVIGSLMADQLESVSGYGLPYRMSNQTMLLTPGTMKHREQHHDAKGLSELTGWKRAALELAEEHWWIARDWARQDQAMASLMCGLRSVTEADQLKNLPARHIKILAGVSYNKMLMDSSMAMQTALLLTDAEAAPDRVTVARCASPLMAA